MAATADLLRCFAWGRAELFPAFSKELLSATHSSTVNDDVLRGVFGIEVVDSYPSVKGLVDAVMQPSWRAALYVVRRGRRITEHGRVETVVDPNGVRYTVKEALRGKEDHYVELGLVRRRGPVTVTKDGVPDVHVTASVTYCTVGDNPADLADTYLFHLRRDNSRGEGSPVGFGELLQRHTAQDQLVETLLHVADAPLQRAHGAVETLKEALHDLATRTPENVAQHVAAHTALTQAAAFQAYLQANFRGPAGLKECAERMGPIAKQVLDEICKLQQASSGTGPVAPELLEGIEKLLRRRLSDCASGVMEVLADAEMDGQVKLAALEAALLGQRAPTVLMLQGTARHLPGSSTPPLPALALEDEADAMERAFARASFLRGRWWHHEVHCGLSLAELEHALQACNDIVAFHYAGHADGAKGLLLGDSQRVEAVLLSKLSATLLRRCPCLRVVVLNCCCPASDVKTGVAPLVEAGISVIVLPDGRLPDKSALLFAKVFYRSFADSGEVDTAFTAGLAAVRQHQAACMHMLHGEPQLFAKTGAAAINSPVCDSHAAAADGSLSREPQPPPASRWLHEVRPESGAAPLFSSASSWSLVEAAPARTQSMSPGASEAGELSSACSLASEFSTACSLEAGTADADGTAEERGSPGARGGGASATAPDGSSLEEAVQPGAGTPPGMQTAPAASQPPAGAVPWWQQHPGSASGAAASSNQAQVPLTNARCALCNISVTCAMDLQHHLAGKAHQKRLMAAQAGPNALPEQRYCTVCSCTINGSQNYQDHLRGAGHLTRLARQQQQRMQQPQEQPQQGQVEQGQAQQQAQPPHAPPAAAQVAARTEPQLHCEVCDIPINGLRQYNEHLAGTPHARRLRSRQLAQQPL